MSKVYTNVAVSSDTFYSWLGKTNDMLFQFRKTVTVESNTAGDMTTGNGFITGIFGSNTITASIIKGGNVQSNAAVLIASNTNIGNSSLYVTTTFSNVASIDVKSYTTTNTDTQIVDTFSTSTYRAGKYLFSIKEVDALDYQSTELMVLHDSANVYTTEYATLLTDSTLGVFTANIDSGSVRLYVTPTTQNNVIKYHRTLMTA